jgi:phytoene synthase
MRLLDELVCQRLPWRGSRSFAAASLLLPLRVWRPTAAIYAFCRVSDDAVDEPGSGREALDRLRERLNRAY